jgi:hypothetical protein
MRSVFTIVVMLTLAAGLLTTAPPLQAAAQKVSICHIPPDDPTNAHTITVAGPAVQAHLDHGDIARPCEEIPEFGASSLSLAVLGVLMMGWVAVKVRRNRGAVTL